MIPQGLLHVGHDHFLAHSEVYHRRVNLGVISAYTNQIRPGGFSFLGKKDLGYILYGGLPPPNLNKPVKQPSPK